MTIENEVKTKDKTYLYKSILTRKIRRQMLKDSTGSNKIRNAWHREMAK